MLSIGPVWPVRLPLHPAMPPLFETSATTSFCLWADVALCLVGWLVRKTCTTSPTLHLTYNVSLSDSRSCLLCKPHSSPLYVWLRLFQQSLCGLWQLRSGRSCRPCTHKWEAVALQTSAVVLLQPIWMLGWLVPLPWWILLPFFPPPKVSML